MFHCCCNNIQPHTKNMNFHLPPNTDQQSRLSYSLLSRRDWSMLFHLLPYCPDMPYMLMMLHHQYYTHWHIHHRCNLYYIHCLSNLYHIQCYSIQPLHYCNCLHHQYYIYQPHRPFQYKSQFHHLCCRICCLCLCNTYQHYSCSHRLQHSLLAYPLSMSGNTDLACYCSLHCLGMMLDMLIYHHR